MIQYNKRIKRIKKAKKEGKRSCFQKYAFKSIVDIFYEE